MAKIKPIFYGVVQKGKLVLDEPKLYKQHLKTFKREDGEPTKVVMVLEKWRQSRSDNQNRYYWGVVVRMIADELGYSDEEAHEAIKWEFLRKLGVRITTVRSTADLSTVEFEEYLSKVRTWASIELNIMIPLPHEVIYEDIR